MIKFVEQNDQVTSEPVCYSRPHLLAFLVSSGRVSWAEGVSGCFRVFRALYFRLFRCIGMFQFEGERTTEIKERKNRTRAEYTI
jgi:hypothetical protein